MPQGNQNRGQDRINRDQIEEDYGLAYALFKAFPELEKLLRKAVNNNWSPQKFQVELRQTKWFENHSDTWREMTALKYSDPATYAERRANVKTRVDNLAAQFSADLSKKALNRFSTRALLFGWDDDQIRDQLARFVKPSQRGHYQGQLAAVEQDLRAAAARNGIKLERKQMRRWMRQIVRGEADTAQYVTNIREMAAKQFAIYADEIRSGMDLADIASPYIQTMGELLELPPGSLDLRNPKIRAALSGVDVKGNPEKGNRRAMTISEFEDMVRDDPRWLRTEQARSQATDYAVALGEAFGVL